MVHWDIFVIFFSFTFVFEYTLISCCSKNCFPQWWVKLASFSPSQRVCLCQYTSSALCNRSSFKLKKNILSCPRSIWRKDSRIILYAGCVLLLEELWNFYVSTVTSVCCLSLFEMAALFCYINRLCSSIFSVPLVGIYFFGC